MGESEEIKININVAERNYRLTVVVAVESAVNAVVFAVICNI